MKITITGKPGSGKSTVAGILAQKLNCKYCSIGDLRGEIAQEHGLTIDELNEIGKKESWVHKKADEKTIEIGKTKENYIVEGWIAYHFIPHS
jgi:cytidylate kinase